MQSKLSAHMADLAEAEAMLKIEGLEQSVIDAINETKTKLLVSINNLKAQIDAPEPNEPTEPTEPTKRGRKPIYQFADKLKNIGDKLIIPPAKKALARNAVANFKLEKLKKQEEWNYSTITLADGSLEITRIPSGAFTAKDLENPRMLEFYNKENIKKDSAQRNVIELLDNFMPAAIWYCLPSTEYLAGLEILLDANGKPILGKDLNMSQIFQIGEIYDFMIYKTGKIYDGHDRQQALYLSANFLIRWNLDDLSAQRKLFDIKEFPPTRMSNLTLPTVQA